MIIYINTTDGSTHQIVNVNSVVIPKSLLVEDTGEDIKIQISPEKKIQR